MYNAGRQPGKQLVQSRRRLVMGKLYEARQRAGAHAIELAPYECRARARSHQCPIFGTLIAPRRQGVRIEPDRPHRTLHRIVPLSMAFIKVRALSHSNDAAHSPKSSLAAFLRKGMKRCLKLLLQGFSQRPQMRLSARAALGIRSAAEGFPARIELRA